MPTDSTFYDRNWTVLQKLKYLEQWFKTNSLDPSTITFEEYADEANKTITITVSGTTYEGNSVTLPSITCPYLEGPQGETGPQGEQGEKGDTGYSLWLSSSDASNNTMYTTWLSGYTTRSVQVNDLIYSATSFSLYRVTAVSGTTLTVVYVGTTKGDQGEQGIQGVQGEQGYSGLSIYDMAAAVTTSGTTVNMNVFTVPSGFTVQVGDLVIGTDGILGQVYSISGSNYTIRYIMNLLLSSDTYVTLSSYQDITSYKTAEMETFTNAIYLPLDSDFTSGYVHMWHFTGLYISFGRRATIKILDRFGPAPSYITFGFNSYNNFYFFAPYSYTGNQYYYTYKFDGLNAIVDIYLNIPASAKNSPSIVYSFLQAFPHGSPKNGNQPWGTLTEVLEIVEGDILTDIPDATLPTGTEYNIFGLDDTMSVSTIKTNAGIKIGVNTSNVALKTDIPTVPNLYNYQVFTRMGYGTTAEPSLIFSFSMNTSEQLAFASASTATDYYLLLANYIYNHYIINSNNDVDGFGVTATGTFYSSSATLSYMVVAVEAGGTTQMGITYITSDTLGTVASESFLLYGELDVDYIPCNIRVTETAPDGTVTYYTKTQTS